MWGLLLNCVRCLFDVRIFRHSSQTEQITLIGNIRKGINIYWLVVGNIQDRLIYREVLRIENAEMQDVKKIYVN